MSIVKWKVYIEHDILEHDTFAWCKDLHHTSYHHAETSYLGMKSDAYFTRWKVMNG